MVVIPRSRTRTARTRSLGLVDDQRYLAIGSTQTQSEKQTASRAHSLEESPQRRIDILQHVPHNRLPRHCACLAFLPPRPKGRRRGIARLALFCERTDLGRPFGLGNGERAKGGECVRERFVVGEEIISVECVDAVLVREGLEVEQRSKG